MATVEIELRGYKKRKTKIVDGKKVIIEQVDGLQPLVLRVTSGKVVTRKNTGLYIRAAEWDPNKRRVNRKHSSWSRLNDALDVLCKEAEGVKADLIKSKQRVTGKAVMAKVFAITDFYEAVEAHCRSLSSEQAGTRNNFGVMAARLKKYAPSLAVEDITPELIEGFKAHLTREKYAYNTIIVTLSSMRTIVNTLELKGRNPFDRVTVGTYRAAKVETLDMADIEKLRAFEPRTPGERLAKDAFLFSFYAAGMRSADVLGLRWDSIKGDRIIYAQNKKLHRGAEALSIPLNDVTREILSRYERTADTVFDVLEVIGGSKAAILSRMRAQHLVLRRLEDIGKAAKIKKKINFKLARTTFGRIANEVSGRNVYGIQQAMGHSNVRTTEIYLGSDVRAVDELLGVVYG